MILLRTLISSSTRIVGRWHSCVSLHTNRQSAPQPSTRGRDGRGSPLWPYHCPPLVPCVCVCALPVWCGGQLLRLEQGTPRCAPPWRMHNVCLCDIGWHPTRLALNGVSGPVTNPRLVKRYTALPLSDRLTSHQRRAEMTGARLISFHIRVG